MVKELAAGKRKPHGTKSSSSENAEKKKIYYVSAEFLIGKLLSNNLINLGIYDEVKELLAEKRQGPGRHRGDRTGALSGQRRAGQTGSVLPGLHGNVWDLPGDGIGLNYHLGLFRQEFEDELQKETAQSLDRRRKTG